jgi:peptidoglycan hydrolase-like protein with peptidoglycan-binding domain
MRIHEKSNAVGVIFVVCIALLAGCNSDDGSSQSDEYGGETDTEIVGEPSDGQSTTSLVETPPTAKLQFRDAEGWSWEFAIWGNTFLSARKDVTQSPPGKATAVVDLISYKATFVNLDAGRTPPERTYSVLVGYDQPMPNFSGDRVWDECFGYGVATCEIGWVGLASYGHSARVSFNSGVSGGETYSFVMEESAEEDINSYVSVLGGPVRWIHLRPTSGSGCHFEFDFENELWSQTDDSAYGCEILGQGPADEASSGSNQISPTTTVCDQYIYDDQLPIEVCSQGRSVEMAQEFISAYIDSSVVVDGLFGPDFEQSVRETKSALGLPVNSTIDAEFWDTLGITTNAPYPDLNGDGVVDASELPAD